MSTPQEYLTARAPASFTSDPNLDSLIAQAEAETADNVFPTADIRNKAVALLVCHWLALKLRGDSSVSGNVKSEKEGDLSRSYGESSIDNLDPFLSQTSWGVELYNLQRSNIIQIKSRFF